MSERFDTYINRVLSHEGGYIFHAKDPGGETKWGISKRAYPNLDIKNLTREAAVAIYKRDYWKAVKGDELPDPLAFQVFDAAVNSGVGRATKWLQQALGTLPDGIWGPVTDQGLLWMDTPEKQRAIALKYISTRLSFYTDLSTWSTFGRGWTRRMADNIFFLQEDM